MIERLVVGPEVADALATDRPVVALESTIFSTLGLPAPANGEALDRCLRTIRARGVVPAVTAVLDGRFRVGLGDDEHERILGSAHKVAERDLAVAAVAGRVVGVTTVSASLALAALAGIRVFATGGIGGVHLDAADTDDVSADLTAIAAHPVVTVCAGPKSFLDPARTLERLETLGVPVIGLGTDELPLFYARSSGLRVPVRLDDPAEVAEVASVRFGMGHGGVLVAVPIPVAAAVADDVVRSARDVALAEAAMAGVTGAAVTPFVLAAIASATGGRSIPANLALAERNADVAAAIAAAFADSGPDPAGR